MKQTLKLICGAMLAAVLTQTPGAHAAGKNPMSPVTLINVFEINADQIDATLVFWEKAHGFLQDQPGYISTNLHRSLNSDARFQLVNIAQWETVESFQTAINKMRQSNLGREMKDVPFHAGLYQVVRSDLED